MTVVQTQTINIAVLSDDRVFEKIKVVSSAGIPVFMLGCHVFGHVTLSTGRLTLTENAGYLIVDENNSEVTLCIPKEVVATLPQEAATYNLYIRWENSIYPLCSGTFTITDPAYPISETTAWDDLRISGAAFKATGGIKAPDFAVFKNDGATSHGVFIYWFDSATVEDVFFYVQLPHNWVEGSSLYPHLHFVVASNESANQFPQWGLEYTLANVSGSYGNTSTVYTDASTPEAATIQGDTTLVAGKHYIAAFAPIVMTGKTLSTMLLCRLFRAIGGTDDDYPADAGVLEFDFHYEIDGFGSKSPYVR